MDKWKHLLVSFETEPTNQVRLVPSQPEIDGRFLQGTQDSNVVDLLDELGRRGWQLIAVQGREFWFRQPVPPEPGEVHVW